MPVARAAPQAFDRAADADRRDHPAGAVADRGGNACYAGLALGDALRPSATAHLGQRSAVDVGGGSVDQVPLQELACHQADGRGAEKLGKSLVGSEFTLDVPGVPVRVLINGKEGSVGLMPPLGSALTDEQIAAVLTYVRRECCLLYTSPSPRDA